MIGYRLGALFAALLLVAASASAAQAAPAPAWSVESRAVPTNFVPGDEVGDYSYEVIASNTGGAPTSGSQVTLTNTLPAGLTVKKVELWLRASGSVSDQATTFCKVASKGEVQTVTCTIPAELPGSKPALVGPSESVRMRVHVAVPADASGSLLNSVGVQGGGAADQATFENQASMTPAPSGFELFDAMVTGSDGALATQAASHPYQASTNFAINTKATPPWSNVKFAPAGGDVKDVEVKLPPGFVGDPTATSQCTQQQFRTSRNVLLPESKGFFTTPNCPDASVVGLVIVEQTEGVGSSLPISLYNLEPPRGMPAQFGFQVFANTFYIDTSVRTGDDYGITATLRNTTEVKRVTAARVVLWGAPADAVHDSVRGACANQIETYPFDFDVLGSLGSCPAGLSARPFFRLPTSCAAPLRTEMIFDTWTHQGSFVSAASTSPAPEGCSSVPFNPTISARPQVSAADSPSGLRFNLHLPQPQSEGLGGLATADLRDVVVTLPEGVSINPSSAAGLAGCAPAEIELDGPEPARCPDASKVGSVEVSTPLLDHPVEGSVYVATQGSNPFGSLIAIYIAAHDPESGVVLKLAGRVEPDPTTGRLTTRFADNPQLPFEDLSVEFFEGPRAPLRTPSRCGTYSIATALTPWSAPDSGPAAAPSDSFQVTSGPGGGPCPSGALAPKLAAGVATPLAGAYSPFSLRLSREDGGGEFAALDVATPPGLTAKLAGILYCPEAAIALATSRGAPGDGGTELASPSCPAASKVGSIVAGAGAGPSPFYTRGDLYLAGPYKGAPLSLLAAVPAVAGPFDLGLVTTRIALDLDPHTAQVSALSDPFPTILAGIPLDVREIKVSLDRPGFTLAPTSCEPMSVNAIVRGTGGQAAAVSDRFQVGACKALDFAPRLSLELKGGVKRGAHPALRAVLLPSPGEANIRRVSVALPHSEFLEQSHIKTICTRVQFAARACPKGSIYGKARAFTPLLDQPLEGPVYLRSSSNPLPDLVVTLRGQIDIDLVGRIDSVDGGIRTTFATAPDAPVSKFVLEMQGAKKGLLVNSTNICKGTHRALAKFAGHSGKSYVSRAPLRAKCPE